MNTGKQLISLPPCGWPMPRYQTKDMPFSCVHNTYSFKEKAQQPLLAPEFLPASQPKAFKNEQVWAFRSIPLNSGVNNYLSMSLKMQSSRFLLAVPHRTTIVFQFGFKQIPATVQARTHSTYRDTKDGGNFFVSKPFDVAQQNH